MIAEMIVRWSALWADRGRCHTCHQEAGRPCLELSTTSERIYRVVPHPGRPVAGGLS